MIRSCPAAGETANNAKARPSDSVRTMTRLQNFLENGPPLSRRQLETAKPPEHESALILELEERRARLVRFGFHALRLLQAPLQEREAGLGFEVRHGTPQGLAVA